MRREEKHDITAWESKLSTETHWVAKQCPREVCRHKFKAGPASLTVWLFFLSESAAQAQAGRRSTFESVKVGVYHMVRLREKRRMELRVRL